MLLLLVTYDVPLTPDLQSGVERRLRFAADRFADHVREISVNLRDVNGRKGGIDILCHVSAKFHNGDRVRVEQRSATAMAAIGIAAKRLRRVLSRRIARGARSQCADAAIPPSEYWYG